MMAWMKHLLAKLAAWHRADLAELETQLAHRPLTRHVRDQTPATCKRELATVGAPAPAGRPAVTPETHVSDDFVDKILAGLSTSPVTDLDTATVLAKDLNKEQLEAIRTRLTTWGTDHHSVNDEKGDLFDHEFAFTMGPIESSMVLPQLEPMIRALPAIGKVAIDRINVAKDLNIAVITIGMHVGEKNTVVPGHEVSKPHLITWAAMVEGMLNATQAAIMSMIDCHDHNCETKVATDNWKAYDVYYAACRKLLGPSPKGGVMKSLFRDLME